MSNNVVLYDLSKILKILNVTQNEFIEICVLTGTDYNTGIGNINNIYNNFVSYKTNDSHLPLYEWMNTKLGITNDVNIYPDICDMFKLQPYIKHSDLNKCNHIKDLYKLKVFLKKYNFIFIEDCLKKTTTDTILK